MSRTRVGQHNSYEYSRIRKVNLLYGFCFNIKQFLSFFCLFFIYFLFLLSVPFLSVDQSVICAEDKPIKLQAIQMNNTWLC